MNFWQAIKTCFIKYVTFKGRALRSEYWYFMLFHSIMAIILNVLDSALFGAPMTMGMSIFTDTSPIGTVFGLATILPSLAVSARRLHDINRSGWWLLICPTGIGMFLIIYWAIKAGDQEENDYGPPPVPAT